MDRNLFEGIGQEEEYTYKAKEKPQKMVRSVSMDKDLWDGLKAISKKATAEAGRHVGISEIISDLVRKAIK